MCADETNRCAQLPPIPYPIYSKNIRDKTSSQIKEYVCGTKIGVEKQCCDPFDPAANDIVKDGNLIKIIKNDKGDNTEFHVCKCTDVQCEEQFCKDFKQPTQYERCKARAVDQKNEEFVSKQVYKVMAANTYTNCYQLCQ